MEQPRVLVVVDDLFFLTKIQTTLKHLGLTAQVLTQRAAIQEYVKAAVTPVLVVVDLTLRTDDAVAVIRSYARDQHLRNTISTLNFFTLF